SHVLLDQLVGTDVANPITEIWYWQPALPTGQFVESPQLPTIGGSQWVQWTRVNGSLSVLQRLSPNAAYLVRLPANTAPYNWLVKGKPVAPSYQWTLSGLNFIGFPVAVSPAPFFEAFVAPAPELQQNGEFYR